MTQPFLGQIQPFGFGFAPRSWAQCNGQLLSIAQNTALFSLLGTYYGGNGTTNFALPDLRSRVPMHQDGGIQYPLGEQAGEEAHTLVSSEMPVHTHTFSGTTDAANTKQPMAGAALATTTKTGGVSPGDNYYATAVNSLTAINIGTLSNYAGGGQAHTNLQPYLTINWCIAMNGIYPSRN